MDRVAGMDQQSRGDLTTTTIAVKMDVHGTQGPQNTLEISILPTNWNPSKATQRQPLRLEPHPSNTEDLEILPNLHRDEMGQDEILSCFTQALGLGIGIVS